MDDRGHVIHCSFKIFAEQSKDYTKIIKVSISIRPETLSAVNEMEIGKPPISHVKIVEFFTVLSNTCLQVCSEDSPSELNSSFTALNHNTRKMPCRCK